MSVVFTETTDETGQHATLSIPIPHEGCVNVRVNLENGSVYIRTVASSGSTALSAPSPSDAPPAYKATSNEASDLAPSVPQVSPKPHEQPSPVCFVCHPHNKDAFKAGFVCSDYDAGIAIKAEEASNGCGSDPANSTSRKRAPRTRDPQDTRSIYRRFMDFNSLNWQVAKCIGDGDYWMGLSRKIYRKRAGIFTFRTVPRTGLSTVDIQKAANLLFWVRRRTDDAEAVLRIERYLKSVLMHEECTKDVQDMDQKRKKMLKDLHEERADGSTSDDDRLATPRRDTIIVALAQGLSHYTPSDLNV
ncbi:unnamed protein product [Peniophora sp. CBMAI 1063]|nr:unnamed protein product [Peniophora sp. CBMAI 1063]